MKHWAFTLIGVVLHQSSVFAVVVQTTQFMSTLQLAVDEPNSQLTQRSQKLVEDQFAVTVKNWPELNGHAYDVRTDGREVVFYMVTDDDTRVPMQRAVSSMIQRLNGKVRARGRSLFYKTPMTPANGGYLDVGVDDSHTKILYTSAQGVPLRQLLKELKSQLGTLSYLIPGECADRPVDWDFGDPNSKQPKPIDVAMGELAALFNLKYEKRNQTHIFSGGCTAEVPRPLRNGAGPFLNTSIIGGPGGFPGRPPSSRTYRPVVYFPLAPLVD
jgi:hypothetical protein